MRYVDELFKFGALQSEFVFVLVIFNPVIFVWFTVYRNTIPVPRGNTGLILTKLNKADAKSTTSYFLGPTFLGPPK